MHDKFQINCVSGDFETESFTFPGGEVQVRVPGLPSVLGSDTYVTARLQSSDALMRLVLLADILERVRIQGQITAVIPYFPYARQDRRMVANEAFSLKPVGRLINSLKFDRVVICDPHSDVTPALIDRADVITQGELIASHSALYQHIRPAEDAVIIAPDAGAAKKAALAAIALERPLVTASKVRSVVTGEITGTALSDPAAVAGRPCLILDDICDGGRTFIELAKVLRAAGATKVWLYVTHGIFSKGMGVFHGLIDAVFTTDSFRTGWSGKPGGSPVPLYVTPISRVII